MKQNNKNILALGSLAMFAMTIGQLQAASITVPNGSFETLYYPGQTTVTATISGGWTGGVGLGAAVAGGTAVFSDASTSTTVDVPGWVTATGWLPSYDVPANRSGSVGAENPAFHGNNYYLTNGSAWGNDFGGAIESAASLGLVASGESYTLSMFVRDNNDGLYETAPGSGIFASERVGGRTLDLLADGVLLTPSSFTGTEGAAGTWNEFTNTYDAASLAAVVGQNLTIRVGWAMGVTGTQSELDNVTLTSASAIPEPTSLSLLALGALGLVRRKRR